MEDRNAFHVNKIKLGQFTRPFRDTHKSVPFSICYKNIEENQEIVFKVT